MGRVRRALDTWVSELRKLDALDGYARALIPELRTMADKLDDDQDDPDVSSYAHTAAATRYADMLERLRPPPTLSGDDLQAFRDAVRDASAAVRDTAPSGPPDNG